ncbi:hypothetical protein BKA69DRAFT_1070611 [Paraphysoderma sedebokerense]|nr:hypothetical protein BKA69DRAFT_1070611 [Paraphysoderma sedebokerense]
MKPSSTASSSPSPTINVPVTLLSPPSLSFALTLTLPINSSFLTLKKYISANYHQCPIALIKVFIDGALYNDNSKLLVDCLNEINQKGEEAKQDGSCRKQERKSKNKHNWRGKGKNKGNITVEIPKKFKVKIQDSKERAIAWAYEGEHCDIVLKRLEASIDRNLCGYSFYSRRQRKLGFSFATPNQSTSPSAFPCTTSHQKVQSAKPKQLITFFSSRLPSKLSLILSPHRVIYKNWQGYVKLYHSDTIDDIILKLIEEDDVPQWVKDELRCGLMVENSNEGLTEVNEQVKKVPKFVKAASEKSLVVRIDDQHQLPTAAEDEHTEHLNLEEPSPSQQLQKISLSTPIAEISSVTASSPPPDHSKITLPTTLIPYTLSLSAFRPAYPAPKILHRGISQTPPQFSSVRSIKSIRPTFGSTRSLKRYGTGSVRGSSLRMRSLGKPKVKSRKTIFGLMNPDSDEMVKTDCKSSHESQAGKADLDGTQDEEDKMWEEDALVETQEESAFDSDTSLSVNLTPVLQSNITGQVSTPNVNTKVSSDTHSTPSTSAQPSDTPIPSADVVQPQPTISSNRFRGLQCQKPQHSGELCIPPNPTISQPHEKESCQCKSIFHKHNRGSLFHRPFFSPPSTKLHSKSTFKSKLTWKQKIPVTQVPPPIQIFIDSELDEKKNSITPKLINEIEQVTTLLPCHTNVERQESERGTPNTEGGKLEVVDIGLTEKWVGSNSTLNF